MCVLVSSTTFVWNISRSKKNWARYDQKRLAVFMWSTRYSCPIVMRTEFSRHFFEKYSNIKFHENSSGGTRVVPCGKTDGQTQMTKLRAAFRNFARVPKNLSECIRSGYPEHDAGTETISQFLLKHNVDNLKPSYNKRCLYAQTDCQS